jgi:hypothetical protein
MTSSIALKEWACVVAAVAKGEHLILVRKGGLEDPSLGFVLKAREFLLYPTWEHQKLEWIRPEFHASLQPWFRPPDGSKEVSFTVYAGVAVAMELEDPSVLTQLRRYHIWNDEFFQARKRYRPERPMTVMVIRAYRLRQPWRHPMAPEEAGCKSWVDLKEEVPLDGVEPIVENRAFRSALETIHAALIKATSLTKKERKERRP